MHYVAVRDDGDLAGKPMTPNYVDPDSDRKMVWACSTLAGAYYWAYIRLGQDDPKDVMQVYETTLDEVSVCRDPNYDVMPSSMMAVNGTFGRCVASFVTRDEVRAALAEHRGEDPYVDRMLPG